MVTPDEFIPGQEPAANDVDDSQEEEGADDGPLLPFDGSDEESVDPSEFGIEEDALKRRRRRNHDPEDNNRPYTPRPRR